MGKKLRHFPISRQLITLQAHHLHQMYTSWGSSIDIIKYDLYLIYKVKVTFQNIQNAKKYAKSHFSPIKTDNLKFFINKSLSYFSLRNLVLHSEFQNFQKWPTYGHFVTDKCAKSRFSPIKTENFKFFINKSLSYFSLRNLVLHSEFQKFSKWPTYGHFVTDKSAKSHFSPIKTENFKFFINKSFSYFSLRNLVLL